MRKAAGQAAQEAQKRFERHDIPSDQLADRLSEKRGAVAEAQKASDQRPRYQEGIRKLEAQWEPVSYTHLDVYKRQARRNH